MCNLCSLSRSQDEIRRFFKVDADHASNLPSLLAIFPDQMVPLVRAGSAGRELLTMR